MAHAARPQPSKIFRGTVEEVFSHMDEIPPQATVELKIFEQNPKPSELGKELKDGQSAPEVKKLRGYGMFAGTVSVDEFLRRKHEDTLKEDLPIR